MIVDCALEPRSAVAANIGIEKNEYIHQKEQYFNSGIIFNKKLMQTAYGTKGLGNSLLGK